MKGREFKDAMYDGADEEEIRLIDSKFHEHYDNYLMYSENYSHSLLTNHYHDSDHGMHVNDEKGHDEGEGHDEGAEEGHDEGNENGNHHTRGEHNAEDHEDIGQLMEEHDEMDIHH